MFTLFVGLSSKRGEVAAQHDEVGAHGQSKRQMMIVHDAAVGADGNVHARLLEVLVACLRHFDGSGGLAAADAFCSRVMQMEPPPMPP